MHDISRSALCSSTTDDPDLFCLLFDKSLRSILDHHAPVLHKTVTTRPHVPWINDEILTAKRHRRKAERRWRASRSTTDLLSFHSCRNRVTFLLNKARCAYYTNFVSESVSTRGNFSLHVNHYLICQSVLVSLYILIPVNWLMILVSSFGTKLISSG